MKMGLENLRRRGVLKTIKKVVLLLFATAFSLVLFIGCASQVRNVTASIYTEYNSEHLDGLELKVKFKSAYATGEGTNFFSKNTLPELKEQIDEQKQKGYSLETTLYGERFLLIDKTVDGHIYHYILVRRAQTPSGGWRYDFMHMEENVVNSDKEHTVWQIPFHLFGDSAYEELLYSQDEGGEYFYIRTDRAYPAEHGIDEFYDFYKVIENYTVSREDNVLSLQNWYKGVVKVSIHLRFDETESGTTVTYYDSVYLD